MSSKKGLELLKAISKYMTETNGFDRVLSTVQIIDGGKGRCTAELKVQPEHLNRAGGLHGGLSATIVDCITTYALMTKDENNIKAGVSVDMHVSFLKGAKEDDELIIEANTIRCGRTLAFLECEIKHKKDNSVVARGSHTKFVGASLGSG